MSFGISGLSDRSGGLLLFPKKFHLWLVGILLCIGTCFVSLYFCYTGVTYIPEDVRILGGLIGVSIFTYLTAPLVGYIMWVHPQTRLGFSLYWALMAGLGVGWVFGPTTGLGAGVIMIAGLYGMEHLLRRSGFIGGIFDGLYVAFGMAALYLGLVSIVSLLAFHQVLHPRVLLIACAFRVVARLLGKMFTRLTGKKQKRKLEETWGYKLTHEVSRTVAYASLSVLIFLDTRYIAEGICIALLLMVVEFAPTVRRPIEIDDTIINPPNDL